MNVSAGSATHVANRKRDYDNTVQMRLFVMTTQRSETNAISVDVNSRAVGSGEKPKRRHPCVSCSASRS